MNSRAASWALRHKHIFPVDERELKGMALSDQIVIGASEEDDDLGINIL
jgi:predicted DNA-binding helix-hairpin-helix protein